MSGAGFRVSIPNSVKKTIHNIKEITGNHTDEDIYAMLKECSMDPNETTQKLLLQDPFHEVKRKRVKKKENTIKESPESRGGPNLVGHGSRGGPINHPRRNASSHDASLNSTSRKEHASNKVSPKTQESKNKETTVSESSATLPIDKTTTIPENKPSFANTEKKSTTANYGGQGKVTSQHDHARASSNHKAIGVGPQKAGPSKEWKAKQPIKSNPVEEPSKVTVKAGLYDSQVEKKQHVIIPDHIHVPYSQRSGLTFGTIDATIFQVSSPIQTSHQLPSSNNQNDLASDEEGDCITNHPKSPITTTTTTITRVEEGNMPTIEERATESDNQGQDQQYSPLLSTPNYGFGLVPSPPLDNKSESHPPPLPRDDSSTVLPTFFMQQQPFDPTNYYAQFYRPPGVGVAADSDLVAAKYCTNVPAAAVLSPPHTPQEIPSMSTPADQTQLVGVTQTQASGGVPVPVFRTATGGGVHLASHYPANYIVPYAHYFSPFYVQPPPPPAIHQQYMTSNATVYPPLQQQSPQTVAAKYSPSGSQQLFNKPMPNSYGAYVPSSFHPDGTTSANQDLAATSQFKDIHAHHQSEGLGVWIGAPGRDMPPNSYYNIPLHQGNYSGMYQQQQHHPGQAVMQQQQSMTAGSSVDMTRPANNVVYQQQQQQQMNWPNNY